MKIALHNKNISLWLEEKSGSITAVTDGKETYEFSAGGFSLVADGVTYFARAQAESFSETDNGVEFLFREGEFTAKLRYLLPEEGAFVERELSFCKGEGGWNADRIVCEDFRLAKPADEILFHDDQTLWHVPTNYFLRYEKGGLYCGLEYPYWNTDVTGTEGLTLGFSPNYAVKAGEWFVCEKTFLGVYTKEGITRTAHGPYPGPISVTKYYPDIFENGGIEQHFPDNILPENAGLPIETLDWGEIWAMQDFFRCYLPLQRLPEEGWFLWQNGWWAQLFSPDVTCLEPLRRAGVKDLLTAAIYFGHDNHPTSEPSYIRDMRIEPLGFPIYKEEHLGVQDSNNEPVSYLDRQPEEIVGYTETFEAPRPYDEFIKVAAEQGIHICSFSTPGITYSQRPEWAARHADGSFHEAYKARLGCPACDEYMEFHYDVITRMMDRYRPRFWSFDGRWINYVECANRTGWIGEEQCFAENHGHPVGDKTYKEWKNIEAFKAKLRARYPELCMEQYYGLKRGGVWSLRNFNADENYYEMGTVPNNRLQTWHNENGRFRPVYMNYSSIFGDTPAEFEVSIISALSTSYYAQISRGYHALRDYPESAGILKKWKAFADENLRFLQKRRTLFGEPGHNAVDGSAHVIGDEGYLFLFTAGGNCVDARIPMMRWIGLEENPEARYRIRVVAAVNEKGEEAGCAICDDIVSYNGTLRCRITPDTAVILKVEAVDNEVASASAKVVFAAEDEVVEAF